MLQTIGKLASARAGRPITAVAKQGKAPALAAPAQNTVKTAPAADPFRELVNKSRALGAEIK